MPMAPFIGFIGFIIFLDVPRNLARRPGLRTRFGILSDASRNPDDDQTEVIAPEGHLPTDANGTNKSSDVKLGRAYSAHVNIDDLKKLVLAKMLVPSALTNSPLMQNFLVPWHPSDEPTDWSTLLLFRLSSITIVLIGIFAAVLHKKLPNAPSRSGTPARCGDPYVVSFLPIVTIVTVSIGAAYGSLEVLMSQIPLVFMLLGFGLAQLDVPAKWNTTFAPMIGGYAFIICCLSWLSEGQFLHSAKGLLRVIVPMSVLVEQKSDVVGDVAASYGAALICLFLLPALQRVVHHYASRHYSVVSMVLVMWVAAVVGIGIDFGLYNMKLMSIFSFIFSSVAARSHLPSFATGIILAYCPPPSRGVRTTMTGLMCVLAYGFFIMVHPTGLAGLAGFTSVSEKSFFYMAERGLMLPLEAGMLWAFEGVLPRPSWLPAASFAPIFLLPMSSFFVASSFRWGSVIGMVLAAWLGAFAVEMVASKLALTFYDGPTEPDGPQFGAPIESAPFLGEHPKSGWQNRLRSLSLGFLYYLVCLSSVIIMSLFFWEVRPSAIFASERRTQLYHICSSLWLLVFGMLVAPWFSLNTLGHLLWPAPVRKAVPRMLELLGSCNAKQPVLVFRYVTRGDSPTLMAENVQHSLEVLKLSGLPEKRWRLEVVTDRAMNLQGHVSGPIFETVVPDNYRCPNGGLYKARALHWAMANSATKPLRTDWIVHLDEETLFDTHTVCAMYEYAILENSRVASSEGARPSIGQGMIVYNCYAQKIENHLTSLTDLIRVADDFGRFQVAYKLCGRPLCGMHGSFVVCSQSVEEDVGFDHGVEGSITEDAYFAMICGHRLGVKIAWIDAFMYEQSPFTITDLVRQRARWFHGLWYCSFTTQIPLSRAFVLRYMMISWSLCGWLCVFTWPLQAANIIDPAVVNLLVIPRAVWLWNFVLGFMMSFSPHREGWPMWCLLLLLQMMLVLPSILLEVTGVFWGAYLVFSKNVSFFVVQKELPKETDAVVKFSMKPGAFSTKAEPSRVPSLKKIKKISGY